jgi:hypothetical protein
MSYRRTYGSLGLITDKLVPLFSPEYIAETTAAGRRTGEIVADRQMAQERGVLTPAPLTASQLPGALKPRERQLDEGGGTLKTVAIIGALGIIGYVAWRRFR